MKTVFLLAVYLSVISCFTYTKGEDGQPGKPGSSAIRETFTPSHSGSDQKLSDSLSADADGRMTSQQHNTDSQYHKNFTEL